MSMTVKDIRQLITGLSDDAEVHLVRDGSHPQINPVHSAQVDFPNETLTLSSRSDDFDHEIKEDDNHETT